MVSVPPGGPSTGAPSHSVPELAAAEAWLDGLVPRGIQLGLERVEAALARLGDPHKKVPAVIVGGTNGKGSTAAFLAAILHAAGYRAALYTSPHLVSVTERIKIGGHTILPRDFAELAARVRAAVDAAPAIPLTQFEALTVMAFVYFEDRQVDIAVLEVGLGGRLDATNVAPAEVAVLTRIGLDHEPILGSTVTAIAREKVAIVKPRATVIMGASPRIWREVVGPWTAEHDALARRVGVDFLHSFVPGGFRYRGWTTKLGPVRLGLRGSHQGHNAALACAAAEALVDRGWRIGPVAIAEGLMRARHRGRLERLGPVDGWPAILVDGAHNPMGARALARHVPTFLPERPRVLLFGTNPDKDVARLLTTLAPVADAIVLTASRARPVADFAPYLAVARRLGERHVVAEPDAARALALARDLAGPEGGLLVTGSLYLIGDVLPLLPSPDPRPDALISA
ncbi:MAG: bifunctional folylpolyglutamate synthase/dihydrofolate synthase [Deltaproteobacteria bacterium]|nr:bifunctional folylpolyglutamate synthase/dihydrofolate synthase [Deltaproteobacteria bacterium]